MLIFDLKFYSIKLKLRRPLVKEKIVELRKSKQFATLTSSGKHLANKSGKSGSFGNREFFYNDY